MNDFKSTVDNSETLLNVQSIMAVKKCFISLDVMIGCF